MRALLLSAYDTLSHRHWRESLVGALYEFDWTVLTLPPRYFNFRVRGNPLSWLSSEYEALSEPYDVVLATSLVDMATLRGIVPSLANTPLWLYCHENQFAYPVSTTQQKRAQLNHDLDVKMVFLYNLLCADRVTFNSAWNQRSALDGVEKLLLALPDKFNDSVLVRIQEKSDVLPVPLKGDVVLPHSMKLYDAGEPIQVVWNHRWEYDKGPEYLLAFAQILEANSVSALLHVVGQQYRRQPDAFGKLADYLQQTSFVKQGCWGFIASRQQYEALLQSSHVVLSTALHDFQGLSVLEGVQFGCLPLVPDTLVYPEQYPDACRYTWFEQPDQCALSMLSALRTLERRGSVLEFTVQPYLITALAPRYRDTLNALVDATQY